MPMVDGFQAELGAVELG